MTRSTAGVWSPGGSFEGVVAHLVPRKGRSGSSGKDRSGGARAGALAARGAGWAQGSSIFFEFGSRKHLLVRIALRDDGRPLCLARGIKAVLLAAWA